MLPGVRHSNPVARSGGPEAWLPRVVAAWCLRKRFAPRETDRRGPPPERRFLAAQRKEHWYVPPHGAGSVLLQARVVWFGGQMQRELRTGVEPWAWTPEA